jgi:hypothetical protein
MGRRCSTGMLLILWVVGFAAPRAERAEGCAAAANQPVAIADESAIIIWDARAKREHFIRRATFATEARDLGFLVPTPTQPELAEAKDDAFARLSLYLIRPSKDTKGGSSSKERVEVLDQKRIAGQDVAVLKADDAEALAQWLKDHEYQYSATLKGWVKPYLDAHWYVTASKIAKDQNGFAVKNLASAAVRMSFTTEKPFFPYSEPASQREQQTAPGSRLLRIFFLGTEKMQGTLGPEGGRWPGELIQAGRVNARERGPVLELLKLPANTPPASWYMTVFEDRSSPRPGSADLFFSVAEDQTPVLPRRPPDE